MMIRVYRVVICNLCRHQAEWLPIDRLSSSWQCNNPIHGYKYLSSADVTTIKVVPK